MIELQLGCVAAVAAEGLLLFFEAAVHAHDGSYGATVVCLAPVLSCTNKNLDLLTQLCWIVCCCKSTDLYIYIYRKWVEK